MLCCKTANDLMNSLACLYAGVQAQIMQSHPKAVYVHCSAHSVNLMFQDAVSLVAECRDSLNLAKDAINFIRESPKRMNCFTAIQTDSNMSLRPVCPTRWTMRVSSVESMMQNYDSLVAMFTEMPEGSDCTGEARSKANG